MWEDFGNNETELELVALNLPIRLTTCEGRATLPRVGLPMGGRKSQSQRKKPNIWDRAAVVRVGRSQGIRHEHRRESSEPHIDT